MQHPLSDIRALRRALFWIGLLISALSLVLSVDVSRNFHGLFPRPGLHQPFEDWKISLPVALVLCGPFIVAGVALVRLGWSPARPALGEVPADPSSTPLGRSAGVGLVVLGAAWFCITGAIGLAALGNIVRKLAQGQGVDPGFLVFLGIDLLALVVMFAVTWIGRRLFSGAWTGPLKQERSA